MAETDFRNASRLCVTIMNKPQMLAGFFVEALSMAEWFQCRLVIRYLNPGIDHPWDPELLAIPMGSIAEFEIIFRGKDSAQALKVIRHLMANHYTNVAFSTN